MSKGINYETTPVKAGSTGKDIKNKIGDNLLDKVGTGRIVWHLVKRHKFGLVSIYAIAITFVWLFPPGPDLLISMIR